MVRYCFRDSHREGLSGYLAQRYSPEHEFGWLGWSGAVVIVIGLITLALAP